MRTLRYFASKEGRLSGVGGDAIFLESTFSAITRNEVSPSLSLRSVRTQNQPAVHGATPAEQWAVGLLWPLSLVSQQPHPTFCATAACVQPQ